MGIRYALGRFRVRRRYPELARLHDQRVDIASIVARLAEFETVGSLRALVPTHVQAAYVFSTAPFATRMTEVARVSSIDDLSGYILGVGYLGARVLLGEDLEGRSPDDSLGYLTPAEFEQDHYATLTREPNPYKSGKEPGALQKFHVRIAFRETSCALVRHNRFESDDKFDDTNGALKRWENGPKPSSR